MRRKCSHKCSTKCSPKCSTKCSTKCFQKLPRAKYDPRRSRRDILLALTHTHGTSRWTLFLKMTKPDQKSPKYACPSQHGYTNVLQIRRFTTAKPRKKTENRWPLFYRRNALVTVTSAPTLMRLCFLSWCRSDMSRLPALVSFVSENRPTSSSQIRQSQTKIETKKNGREILQARAADHGDLSSVPSTY